MHSKDLNIVFYCKGCTEMFYATSNDPENMVIDEDAPCDVYTLLPQCVVPFLEAIKTNLVGV